MLAIASVLAAELTVLPGSEQEAQANPCADEVTIDIENEGDNPDGITVSPGRFGNIPFCNMSNIIQRLLSCHLEWENLSIKEHRTT